MLSSGMMPVTSFIFDRCGRVKGVKMMDRLEEEMERLRRAMHQQAAELGLNHSAVIRLSQQLDELHNQWNRWRNPSTRPEVDNRAAYIIRRYTSQIKEAALSRA